MSSLGVSPVLSHHSQWSPLGLPWLWLLSWESFALEALLHPLGTTPMNSGFQPACVLHLHWSIRVHPMTHTRPTQQSLQQSLPPPLLTAVSRCWGHRTDSERTAMTWERGRRLCSMNSMHLGLFPWSLAQENSRSPGWDGRPFSGP